MGMAIRRFTSISHFCTKCLYILIISLQHCTGTDILTKDSSISLGQTLVSANEAFELGFFNPGNSTNRYIGIWYKNLIARKVIWVANRENPLLVSDTNSTLIIDDDGNLRILDGEHNSVWSTKVRVHFNETIAKLTDIGNFCLNDTTSGSILWETFDYPSNSLLTGMKLGTNGKTQDKHLMTSWISDDDPATGDFVAGLSAEQPPQALVWRGSKPYYRSGPWDGGKFIGIPEQEAGYSNLISLMPANSQEGAYLTVNLLTSPDNYRWIYINPNGVLQTIYWDNEENMWDISWEAPENPCDVYGVCGSFAICTNNKSPICDCLKGFVPMSNEEWSKSNWTRGCVRRSELLCEKNQSSLASAKSKPDKFQVLKGLKLPDRYHYFPDKNPDECQHWCMGNCSCKAYAFVTGIYCMAWTEDLIDIQQFSFGGENIFLRLSYAEIGEKKNRAALIIGLTTIGGVLLLGGFIFCSYRCITYQKGRKTKLNHLSSDVEIFLRDTLQEDVHESFELPMYEFKQIITATDNFSYRNKLGEGGFGPVYKGMLDHGQHIAVKRLSGDSGQGIDEFKNEIVLISKLQHRNLVKLLGCCIEGTERLLIYEYMTNKSLDAFLFGQFTGFYSTS
nr:G-type lectin S-receptor-like serine/threonine-protein kinase At1g61550 [Tanacetum cinerariifolium]